MTTMKFILWFILTAAVYGALFAVWIPLCKKNKWWISVVGIVLKVLLALTCAYLTIALDTLLPRLLQCFLAMLYTALLADAATELVFLLIRLFKKNGAKMLVRFVAGIAFYPRVSRVHGDQFADHHPESPYLYFRQALT